MPVFLFSFSFSQAAVVPSFPLQFQSEYIQLRASLLEVHTQLLRTCNTFKTCPPPAIAAAQAVAKGQELTKCEHIVTQVSIRLCNASQKLYIVQEYISSKTGGQTKCEHIIPQVRPRFKIIKLVF